MFGGADTLEVDTPAKINLYLEILGRRSNGYHDLRSVVVPISLYDTLRIERTTEGVQTVVEDAAEAGGVTQGGVPDSRDNLTTRAALALKEATGYGGGAVIHLWKRIPVGGGLGGGSSDAGAVLRGLNRLWRTGLAREELMQIGARLGCDVPLFVHGGALLMEGLGERITPLQVEMSKAGYRKTEGWRRRAEPKAFRTFPVPVGGSWSSILGSACPPATFISATR
jgi:4-diphosphocytidyl-2-C-methyl-D-erythritol kinase